jgi:chaperonin GroES
MAKRAVVEEVSVLTYTPIGNRVVIKRDDTAEITDGGIMLPDAAQEKPRMGTVLAVGPGSWDSGARAPMQCNVGDRVVIAPYTDTVTLEGEDVVILREHEILSIIR